MIRTKTEQIINAQLGLSKIIYMHIHHEIKDNEKQLRHFAVVSSILDDKGKLEPITEVMAIFKEQTFQALFGSLTIGQIEEIKDQLLIEQIDFINKYEWTGEEAQPNPVKFWDLTADDLEIVTPEE